MSKKSLKIIVAIEYYGNPEARWEDPKTVQIKRFFGSDKIFVTGTNPPLENAEELREVEKEVLTLINEGFGKEGKKQGGDQE